METYYYVNFGDVKGDGYSDSGDVSIIDGVASWIDFSFMAGDGSAAAMAADVNGDTFVDSGDVSVVDSIASWVLITTQAEIAATVAAGLGVA